MDYEKKYNEALERAKSFQEKYGGGYAEYIFPELAKREDERIRKELVAFFKEMQDSDWHEKYWHDLEIDRILAYLEKQKEEEGYEAIPIENTLEYKAGFHAGREFEKQKEQKPAEWSEEDEERLINTAISFLKDFADKGYENAVECIDWLKSLQGR